MRAPIVISEHGDVSVFDSIEAAENYIEPSDVANAEYEIFDAEGNPFDAKVEMVPGKRILGLFGGVSKKVRISASPTRTRNEERLRELLTQFLLRSAPGFEPTGAIQLLELVMRAQGSR